MYLCSLLLFARWKKGLAFGWLALGPIQIILVSFLAISDGEKLWCPAFIAAEQSFTKATSRPDGRASSDFTQASWRIFQFSTGKLGKLGRIHDRNIAEWLSLRLSFTNGLILIHKTGNTSQWWTCWNRACNHTVVFGEDNHAVNHSDRLTFGSSCGYACANLGMKMWTPPSFHWFTTIFRFTSWTPSIEGNYSISRHPNFLILSCQIILVSPFGPILSPEKLSILVS